MFSKDTLALTKTAQDYKSPLNLVEHVVKSNNKKKKKYIKNSKSSKKNKKTSYYNHSWTNI